MRSLLLLLPLLASCSETSVKVMDAAPLASIVYPDGGSSLMEGEEIPFRGVVSDPDDDPASLATTWLAGADELCAPAAPDEGGNTLCDAVLTAGTYTITLQVTDPGHTVGNDSIVLVITPTGAPTASITAPDPSGIYYSDRLISLEGTVADPEDPADTLAARWSSNLDLDFSLETPPDSAGLVSGATYLMEGEHQLSLNVMDSTGRTGLDTVTVLVGPPNGAPSCAIVEPEDGSSVSAGDLVVFRGTVSDPDVSADQLSVLWSSDHDGEIGDSTPSTSGEVVLSTATLSTNTHTIQMTVSDEDGGTCSDLIVLTVGAPPEIEVLSPSTGDVFAEREEIRFMATVSDDADEPEELSLRWVTDLDGLVSETPADSGGLASFARDDLTFGTHLLTLTATDSLGLTSTARVSFRVNGLPSAPGLSLDPSPAFTDDALVASVSSPSVDPEGEPITYLWSWYRDGALSSASTSATLPASATARGETWRVVATPTDGDDEGSPGEASVTIQNSPPSLLSATITPDPAHAYDTLECAAGGWSDADGDTDASIWSWTLNGVVVGAGRTLSGPFSRGDRVDCVITPFDGSEYGSPVTDSVVIENSAPVADSVGLSPDPAYTNDTLTALAIATDPDGDPVTLSYAWQVDGASVSPTGTTLDGSWFSKHQVVTVTVTPTDGITPGAALGSAGLRIQNTPPTAPGISLAPTAPEEAIDDLLCSVDSTSSDLDGDSVTYSISWTVDGARWTGATGTTTRTGDTIDAAFTTASDVWTCTVTPFDGEESGPSASASVTVVTHSGGTCDGVVFSGATGSTWEHMATAPNDTSDLMTFHPSSWPYIWNSYYSMSRYNPDTNTWTSVSSSMPYTSRWTSMAPSGGYLWMIRNNNVYRFNPASASWSTLASYTGGDDMNVTVADCDGHVYGHANSGSIIDYDTTTGTLVQYPTGLGSQSETRLAFDPAEDALFFGAFSAGNVYRFDLSTHAITLETVNPEGFLNDIFCGDMSGHLYAAGGSSGTSLWQYDIAAGTWSSIPAFPVDHGNNGSCVVSEDGWLYLADMNPSTFYRLALY